MRIFLGVLGVFSFIASGVAFYMCIVININAETVMQEQVATTFLVYSGVMLLAGIVGLIPVTILEYKKNDALE